VILQIKRTCYLYLRSHKGTTFLQELPKMIAILFENIYFQLAATERQAPQARTFSEEFLNFSTGIPFLTGRGGGRVGVYRFSTGIPPLTGRGFAPPRFASSSLPIARHPERSEGSPTPPRRRCPSLRGFAAASVALAALAHRK
jgi:hypothetical protein